VGRRRLAPEVVSLLEQFSQTEGRFLKWAALAVVRWRPSFQEPPVPVAHIHGARDFILPARLTRPDVLVPRAGHMLPITHPEIVNAFLREQRERFAM